MRYDAVIFDLDGTLLNTLDDLAAAVNAALASCGYPPAPWTRSGPLWETAWPS